jgi:hypothetical protein
VSRKEARLKLDSSASEARKLGFAMGANGWVRLPLEALPAATVARRWVAESYGLVLGRVAARTKVKTTAAKKKTR